MASVAMPVSRDLEANRREIGRRLRLAKGAGAQLVHFPEGAASGYAKSEIAGWEDYPWARLQDLLESLAEEAARLQLWLVLGAAHRLTAPNPPHNALYVIGPDGRLVGRYDKRLCSNSELTGWYSPGLEPLLFRASGHSIGCALCIEVQFPEVFRDYAEAGADAVLLSSYSGNPFFLTLAQAHAETNGLWIGFAEAGREATSAIIGPDGQLQAHSSDGMAIATLDPAEARWEVPLRKARPWRRQARKGAIYRGPWDSDPRSRNRDRF